MTPIVGLFLVALVEVALAIVVWMRNPGRGCEPLVRGVRDDPGRVGHAGRRPPQPGRPGGGPRRGARAVGDGGARARDVRSVRRRVPAADGPAAGPRPGGDPPRPVHVGPGVLAVDRGRRAARGGQLHPAGVRTGLPAARRVHDPLLHLGPRPPGGQAPARDGLRASPAPLRLPRGRPHGDRRPHARRRRAARHRILAARRVRAVLHAALARLHRPLHRAAPAHGRAGGHQPVGGLRGGLAR